MASYSYSTEVTTSQGDILNTMYFISIFSHLCYYNCCSNFLVRNYHTYGKRHDPSFCAYILSPTLCVAFDIVFARHMPIIMSWAGQAIYLVITSVYINVRQCPHLWQLHWELVYFDRYMPAFIYLHFVSLLYIGDGKGFENSQQAKLIRQFPLFVIFLVFFCTMRILVSNLVPR